MVSIRIIMRRCMGIDEGKHITSVEYPTKAVRPQTSRMNKDKDKIVIEMNGYQMGKMLLSIKK